MTTQPKLGHIRTDLGVDGIDSIPQTLVQAQDFYTAVTSLTSENGFKALVELFKLLPQRDNDIKAKDEIICELNTKLHDQERCYKVFKQEQLSAFLDKYENWSEDNCTLQDQVEELKTAVKAKDGDLMALRKEAEGNKTQNEDLEEKRAQLTKRLKEMSSQMIQLEARLGSMESDSHVRVQDLAKSRNRVAVLEKSLEKEAERYQSLNAEATQSKERLSGMLQYFVRIKELDLTKKADRIETLWESAIQLVGSFAGRDLPDDILRSDWTKLRENDTFKHRIPLPKTNSEIAKKMRVAVILGAFATLIENAIFQPTYLLLEDNGLRESLRLQAHVDTKQEKYARSILLAMLPEEQEINSKECVAYVVEELLDGMNVQSLLANDAISTVGQALERLVTQFQEEWKIIQCGTQKLDASFAYSPCPSLPWHVFDIRAADLKAGIHPAAPLSSANVEDNIVVVPRLYHFVVQAEPTPLTHGYVLQKAHLDAAEDEIRRSLPSAPFAAVSSSRIRTRSGRVMSVTGDAASNGRGGDRFLSQARGARD
ncbi:hypothetical protein EK21DRAFT_114514 [Setomelanomma holmii]|uniref:Uncharacterized protein n=1 Tax=Setomelanomma holmii TaxID=210430 RepID=A0A9P4H570_9PLEO|nr:hypothetical protein EK21DRAFT_114514 [Setomelanomma holmii]